MAQTCNFSRKLGASFVRRLGPCRGKGCENLCEEANRHKLDRFPRARIVMRMDVIRHERGRLVSTSQDFWCVQLISLRFWARSGVLCLEGMTYGIESDLFRAVAFVTGGPKPFCEESHPNPSQTPDPNLTLGTKPNRWRGHSAQIRGHSAQNPGRGVGLGTNPGRLGTKPRAGCGARRKSGSKGCSRG